MHVAKDNVNGNPNVGLYGLVTDDYVLLGKEVPESKDKTVKAIFNKDIARITIAGTSLINVFCVWHNNTLLVPSITFDHEKEALTKLGIDYEVIETELTCLGNNILLTEKRALLNPDFKAKTVEKLKEVLRLPCEQTTIMEVEAIGSIGVIRNNKGLFHRDIPPVRVRELEKSLGVDITLGTVNMGSPYVKSGILLGEEGFLIGDTSGGPEVKNADEALGFIEV
ncbi:translation initiation factor IF-6 [Candidatus Woesearchaeota archaeon]|nr:translation initiation factor IF-6 [Candidatus Woesearchaeota archaeon]